MSSPATVRHPLIATTGRVQDAPAAGGVSWLTELILHACVHVLWKVRLLQGNVACRDRLLLLIERDKTSVCIM